MRTPINPFLIIAILATAVAPAFGQVGPGPLPGASVGVANTWTAPQTFSAALTYGGVTLLNAVTGTNAMVLSSGPTIANLIGTGTMTTPVLRGGANSSATLVLESTSAVGATDSLALKTGSEVTAINIDTNQNLTLSGSGAASTAAELHSGALFTGGTGTTNLPMVLFQPTGTTAATTWSANGTVIGANEASGFSGRFIDLHINGAASVFNVDSFGDVFSASTTTSSIFASAYPGAASSSVVSLTGTTFTGGTGTTNFPRVFIQPTGTAAVTTWSTASTDYGINETSGFAGNFLDFHVAGGASVLSVSSGGGITAQSGISTGSVFQVSGKSLLASPSNGIWEMLNNGSNGFTRLQFGGTTSSFGALQTNGIETDSELADGSALAPFKASYTKTSVYTVAALPASPGSGATAAVSDAVACTFLATLTGGGSTYCPVVFNGTAWVGG